MKLATTILVLCGVVILSTGCSSKSTTTVKTQTYTVQKGSLSVAVTGTGNLALSRTEDLAFEMAGTVEAVLVDESETVKKGQELVKLDTTEWDTQLKTLAKALVTAQRNLTTKEKALTTAQRLVTTKESAVTTAQRQVESKKLAVTQAELNIQTAINTLDQITEVKKVKDAVDDAESYLKIVRLLSTSADTGTYDSAYWANQITAAKANLADAQQVYNEVVSGVSTTISSDVALQVAQKVFAVDQAKFALVDAQIAVEDARSAVETAQIAVDDAKSALADAQLDVADTETAVADAQSALDEAKSLSPIITAPFDGFISKINVAGGDEILKGTVALVIADPNQFSAKILVTEEDVFSVKLGGDATVSLTALSDLSFPAKVTKISPTATVSSGVVNYSVTVNITSLQPVTATQTTTSQLPSQSANRTAPAGMPSGNFTAPAAAPAFTSAMTPTSSSTTNVTLKDGLSAVVDIISQQKDNILIIPSKAITRQNQTSTVQVVKGEGTETRVIQTGMTDGSYTEITEGLSEGEQVVIKSTTSTSSSSTSSSTKSATQQGLQAIGGQGGPPPGGGF